jgi:Fe-S-cluster containining protein
LPNPFEKELGIPLPKCCSLGSCCKGASPSTPYHQLLQRAASGDEFARGFFSIMVPYQSHMEAEAIVPGVVDRTLKAAKKLEEFKSDEDIVFYHCQYQTADNKCGVWEDRPQFCRDYPDTPFVVMAPGCAFEPWAKACKEKYFALKDEVVELKALKAELEQLKATQSAYGPADTKIDAPFLESHNADNLSLVLSLTNLYLSSPLTSMHFVR